MCDYSLCGIPNRLANEGEVLVVHRFRTGSVGLASLTDLQLCEQLKVATSRKTFWQSLKSDLKDCLTGPDQSATTPAVCVPPGAQLIVKGIPSDLQKGCHLSHQEDAVFIQISAEVNTYRDAVRFHNGRQVRLQDLREGMHVQVLSLCGATGFTSPTSKVVNSLQMSRL
jgi:hypothetical protein